MLLSLPANLKFMKLFFFFFLFSLWGIALQCYYERDAPGMGSAGRDLQKRGLAASATLSM